MISILVHQLTEERADLKRALQSRTESEKVVIFYNLLKEISISPSKLRIEISKNEMLETRVKLAKSHVNTDSELRDAGSKLPTLIYKPHISESPTSVLAIIDVEIKKIDGTRYILDSRGSDLYQEVNVKPNFQILAAFKDAYQWRSMLDENRDGSAKLIAEAQNISYMMLLRKLPLASLAPDIQNLALTGGLPNRIPLKQLVKASWQLNWAAQKNQLGI